jgi:3-carboxy-cis,cis-muconate cycloisomerase
VFVLEGMEVHADQMAANLDLTHGLIVSEAVMMGLAPTLGRDRAHDLVYELCHRVGSESTPLSELLLRNKEISSQLSADKINQLTDPTRYLGLAGVMVDRVLNAR